MNTFGNLYRLTSFGESHGPAMGGVIDGVPAGLTVDMDMIRRELLRRRPGQSDIVSHRNEADNVKFLSGIFDGKTIGTPIGFVVENTNQKSSDYDALKNIYRPSHADYVYDVKYGIRDYRGGGRSSARETISRVVAGALAKQFLLRENIEVKAFVSQVGDVKMTKNYKECDLTKVDDSIVRCPDKAASDEMEKLIRTVKSDGDSIGGVITCVVKGVPVGLGEPVFGKLQAQLASAMMSIGAVKGFDYGTGFEGLLNRGSELNDEFVVENGTVKAQTNNSGGIQGGISNGEDIVMRIAFKPVATIMKLQRTVDKNNNEVEFKGVGRHDACVLPRAVVVVEAMAAMVLFDAFLISKLSKM